MFIIVLSVILSYAERDFNINQAGIWSFNRAPGLRLKPSTNIHLPVLCVLIVSVAVKNKPL